MNLYDEKIGTPVLLRSSIQTILNLSDRHTYVRTYTHDLDSKHTRNRKFTEFLSPQYVHHYVP
jgi:hypothetical protein